MSRYLPLSLALFSSRIHGSHNRKSLHVNNKRLQHTGIQSSSNKSNAMATFQKVHPRLLVPVHAFSLDKRAVVACPRLRSFECHPSERGHKALEKCRCMYAVNFGHENFRMLSRIGVVARRSCTYWRGGDACIRTIDATLGQKNKEKRSVRWNSASAQS